MSCNPDLYRRVHRVLEKLEVVSVLFPALETDAEASYTLSVLLDICHDYTSQLRVIWDAAAQEGSEEVVP